MVILCPKNTAYTTTQSNRSKILSNQMKSLSQKYSVRLYGSLTLEEALSGRSSIRNKTLARTLEKIDVLEGWGSGFKRIFSQCEEYGVAKPEFLEIGDMLRVNFYRPSYQNIGDKSAINSENGDKIGDNSNESAINYKEKICAYLSSLPEARTQDIALFIGLK